MAADSAEFKVSLQDDVTKKALAAQASIKSLEAQLRSLNKAAATARGPDALRKFGLSDELKAARGRAQVIKQQAAAQAAAQAKAARVTAQQAKQLASFRQFKADNSLGAQIGEIMPLGAAGAATAAVAGIAVAAAAAAAAVLRLAAAFSQAAIEAASFRQDSVLALTRLIGNAGTATVQFDDLRQEAQRLGLDVHATQKSFQQLLAANFEISEARTFIRLGADLQVVGANAEQVQRAMLAITQIKSKGRLQAEEMLQLQEAGVTAGHVYEELGKIMGKSRDELTKLQQAGKIGADVGLEAIQRAIGRMTGGGAPGEAALEKANTTMTGLLAQLRGMAANTFIDIGTQIEGALVPTLQKVLDLFQTIASDPQVQALGRHLLGEFDYFQASLKENWPETKDLIMSGVHAIAASIRMAADVVRFLIDNWETLRVIGIGLAVVLGVVALGVGVFIALAWIAIGVIVGLVAAAVYAVGWLAENFTKIPGMIWNALASAATWASEAGGNIVRGLIDGILNMLPQVREAVNELASAVSQVFSSRLMIRSPSKLFEQYGVYTVQGYVEGITANDNSIRGATADMAGAAVRGVETSEDTTGGGGRVIHVDFGDINVTAPTAEIGVAVGDHIARQVRAELHRALAEVE